MTLGAGGAGFSQIVVDHTDALPRPAKGDGGIHQTILQFRALLVLANLTSGRLTDVDIGELGAVGGGDPLRRFSLDCQHDTSPVPVWCAARGRTAAPVGSAPSAPTSATGEP